VNQLVLSACIAEVGALRHTPAGLPVMDFHLEHASELEEAGQQRQVRAAIRAVAFGATAERVGRQSLGSAWRFIGFLAAARGGRQLVFHVLDFQPD
jgi:primosomal replication protein N